MTDPQQSNPLTAIITSIGNAIAPGIADQAGQAAQQLTTAFQFLIAEGAIIIGILIVQLAISWKHER